MSGRVPVTLLGATGLVGCAIARRLADHPWFRLVEVCASDRRVALRLGSAVPPGEVDGHVADLVLRDCRPPFAGRLVLSALDSAVAGDVEAAVAGAGYAVVTNAAPHRLDPAVPLVVPEVNAGHLDPGVLERGGIVANPNCSTIGLALALAPLAEAFGLRAVHVATMQALSGAGRAGPSALEMTDDLVPHIAGEEEKVERELPKILGARTAEGFRPADVTVSAHCNRVGVTHGHTACVSVALGRRVDPAEAVEAWRTWAGDSGVRGLPSAPGRPVRWIEDPDGPRPGRHRDLGGGMAVSVGRARTCPLLDLRFVTLSHNLERGAAGGAVLLAETLLRRAGQNP